MCTFFLRSAAFVVLLAGCSRPAANGTSNLPAPRVDTLHIGVPVVRLTTADSANGSVAIDSATLALLERRVMSRVASLLRAEQRMAAGRETDGIPPVKTRAAEIRHGLLGTIMFDEEGSIDPASRDRIAAIARMLDEIDAPLEIRASAQSGTRHVDVAIARARRVYVELAGLHRGLDERDVTLTIASVNSLHPINPTVEIFWRDSRGTAY